MPDTEKKQELLLSGEAFCVCFFDDVSNEAQWCRACVDLHTFNDGACDGIVHDLSLQRQGEGA